MWKNGYSKNDLEPTCLHTLQSWPWFSSGSLKISCVQLLAEETCKAGLVGKKWNWNFFPQKIVTFWVGGNSRERQGEESAQLHPILLLQCMLVREKIPPKRRFQKQWSRVKRGVKEAQWRVPQIIAADLDHESGQPQRICKRGRGFIGLHKMEINTQQVEIIVALFHQLKEILWMRGQQNLEVGN